MSTYQISYSKAAIKDLEYFSSKDKRIIEKIENIILELTTDPFHGIGKPEPLRFNLSGCCSRRITLEHRLVYKVENNLITILSCRHHY